MVITDLAKIKIKELLQEKKAKLLQISLAGNVSDGFQTIIKFLTDYPKTYLTITTSPLVLVDLHAYSQFANSLLDFDPETNEIKIRF